MKPFRARNPIPIALIGIVLIVLGVVAALNSNSLPIIGGGTSYTATVRQAVGLKSGNMVRIAGVSVGKVEDVALDGDKVKVTFKVKSAFVGNKSEAAIKIQTLLGQKYLAVESRGNSPLNPSTSMAEDTANSVLYDVQKAFNGLTTHVEGLNTSQLAKSFQTLSNTFTNTPANVKSALGGLQSLSKTISSRDTKIAHLVSNTSQISKTLSDRDTQVQKLLSDGNLLLAELQKREGAIHSLLIGAQQLSDQLTGLVKDNNAQLKPVLDSLNQLTTLLHNNQNNLAAGIKQFAPFVRLFNNAVGNGRWFDTYICGVLPPSIGPINSKGCLANSTGPQSARSTAGGS
ncbi:MAG: MCE family protein [Sciscionella sp.]